VKAKERAAVTLAAWFGEWEVDLSQDGVDSLYKMVGQAILAARHEAIEDCAAVVDRWPSIRQEEGKPYWPHEIAQAIRGIIAKEFAIGQLDRE